MRERRGELFGRKGAGRLASTPALRTAGALKPPRSQTERGAGRLILARSAVVLTLLALAGAAAADEPKAFACNFTVGLARVYEKGNFVTEEAAPLAFGIEAIDQAAQTAELKMTRGTGHLRIVRAVNAMHFLEVVTEGFLNVTTIYDRDEAKGIFPAVHSRHLGLLGQPVVSQYQGYCEGKG
jgi:hypothetical protein